MQDTEFTVEEGSLYMLQTRNAKRPAQAAVRFAVDAVDEGLLDARGGAARRSTPSALDALLHPAFDPTPSSRCSPRACNASPGAAKGEIVFTADDAVAAAEDGRDVILVRPFTEADDVAGFHAAQGHPDQPRAARPATRRWWRAAWASRASRAPRRSTIDLTARRGAGRTARCCTRAT